MILPTYPWNICQISPKPNKKEITSFTSWLNGQERLVKYTRWFNVTFHPLVGGHVAIEKGHWTIPKGSQRIARYTDIVFHEIFNITPASQDTLSQTSVTARLDVHPFWKSAQQKLLRKNAGKSEWYIPQRLNMMVLKCGVQGISFCKGWCLRRTMVNLRRLASLSLATVCLSPGDDAETWGKTVQNHGDLTTNQLVWARGAGQKPESWSIPGAKKEEMGCFFPWEIWGAQRPTPPR